MKIPMTAIKAFTYAGRPLAVGDAFEATRQEGRILDAIGKAKYGTAAVAAAPVQKMPEPPPAEDAPAGVADDLADLRAQYSEVVGKKPFHGWDADTLRAKIAAHGTEA